MNRVQKRIVIALALAVPTVAFLVSRGREQHEAPVAVSAVEPKVDLSLRCRSSLSDNYSFRYTSEAQFSRQIIGAPSGANKESLSVALHGDWRQHCASESSNLRTMSFELSKVKGHVRGSDPGFDSTESPDTLFSGMAFSKVTSHGEVRNIYFSKNTKVLGQHLLRDLLSLRSFRLPAQAKVGETWKRTEKDLLGTYSTNYRLVSMEKGLATVEKRRVQYDAFKQGAQGMDAQISADNVSVISIDVKSGLVRNVETTLSVSQSVDGTIIGVNKTHLNLSYEGTSSLAPKELAMMMRRSRRLSDSREWISSDTSASDVDERLERRLHEQQLAGRTMTEIRKQIQAQDAFDTDTFLSTKALLVLQPQSAQNIGDLLKSSADPNGAKFQLTSGALAAAGTPEAQAAIIDGINHFDGSSTSQNILLGLIGQVDKPTSETLNYLNRRSQENDAGDGVANSSRLALGSIARHLDSSQREPVVDGLLETLKSAGTTDEKVNALLSLGNTGDVQVGSVLAKGLRDPTTLVRKASCFALGQQPKGSEVEPLLQVALEDKEPTVRVECLDALARSVLEPAHTDAVLNLAMQDAVPEVRLAALRVAGAQEQFPELRSVLRHINEEDQSQDVRRLAELILLRLEASA